MKRFLLILPLVLLPLTVFAQFGIGPVAFYNSPVLAGEDIDEELEDLNTDSFTFGANARLKLSLLHGEALALLTLDPTVVDIFLNAGVALDIAILRLSAGIGPKLTYTPGEELLQGGYNLKLNADVVLGSLSLGLSYIFNVTLEDGFDVTSRRGLLGVSLIFW